MSEKLCIFCTHFNWTKEEMWGMGSTQTGPMFDGGDARCSKGHGSSWTPPDDESDLRKIFLTAASCSDYDEAKL